jgi:hypothetical protein
LPQINEIRLLPEQRQTCCFRHAARRHPAMAETAQDPEFITLAATTSARWRSITTLSHARRQARRAVKIIEVETGERDHLLQHPRRDQMRLRSFSRAFPPTG